MGESGLYSTVTFPIHKPAVQECHPPAICSIVTGAVYLFSTDPGLPFEGVSKKLKSS